MITNLGMYEPSFNICYEIRTENDSFVDLTEKWPKVDFASV